MVATDLWRIAHQLGQRFNVRGFARPVALQRPLGVGVPAGVHDAIVIEDNALFRKAVSNRPEAFTQVWLSPGIARRVPENRSLERQSLPHDVNDFRVDDSDGSQLVCLGFLELKSPLHPFAMVGDVLGGQRGELATIPSPCADADLDGDGSSGFEASQRAASCSGVM